MDKIDEWMNRELNEENNPENTPKLPSSPAHPQASLSAGQPKSSHVGQIQNSNRGAQPFQSGQRQQNGQRSNGARQQFQKKQMFQQGSQQRQGTQRQGGQQQQGARQQSGQRPQNAGQQSSRPFQVSQGQQRSNQNPVPSKTDWDDQPFSPEGGQSGQSSFYKKTSRPASIPRPAQSSRSASSSGNFSVPRPAHSSRPPHSQATGSSSSKHQSHSFSPTHSSGNFSATDPVSSQHSSRSKRPSRSSGRTASSRHFPAPSPTTSSQPKPAQILKGKVKIIPLGGLNEVGKNMTAFEYEDDIIVVDMGLEFPSEDMFGIDYVIPDVTYLEENRKRIRGIVITHGHLDHIGGIPYILPKLDFPPVFATKLTIGLIKKRTEEFKQEKLAKLNVIDPDQTLKLGQFVCTFFRVAHSIPDAVGVIIDTPIGKLVHTGDFKFDDTPAGNQAKADIHKMEALGSQNVLALFCESTNALKPGHSMSEQEVGKTLEKIIREATDRVIIASFSSQVGRIQQIIDAAAANNRKIFVSGRSMSETMNICASLGYLTIPKNTVFDIKKYKKIPDKEALILTTGSQGESVSALARIASNEHPHVKVKKGDTIVLSSSPIIGNERAIFAVINNLSLLGAEVIHNQIMEVHTSGHGKQDELCKMINYVKPKYLIPIHGEYYMRLELGRIAVKRCGIQANNVIMLQNGDVLHAEKDRLAKSGETIETKYILIDGLGEGHIGSDVQMDREIMSQNGALVVLIYASRKGGKLRRDPDVVSRGFIYMHESEEITAEISKLAADSYRRIMDKNPGANRRDIKKYIRQTIDKYTHDKIERRPLIIPLIIES